MTRKRKIEFLRKRGVNIASHRTTARLVVDAVETGGKWHIFKTTIPDQVKAGQLIDKLLIEYVEAKNTHEEVETEAQHE